MKTQPKYNIGDKVWYKMKKSEEIFCNEILHSANLITREGEKCFLYVFHISPLLSHMAIESELFPSKEELLASL